jgi:hypothetical protein
MPTETPASDFGAEANAKPIAASATNVNFFICFTSTNPSN